MVRFAPSSAAILRAIFRTSLSEKPIARSAFRSWQMPKKSTFGFIAISPMHKAGTVSRHGIRFPRFLTFVLPALFVATPQADGRFQTAAAGCRSTGLRPSEDLSELPPLLVAVAGQEYHYWIAGEGRAGLPRSPAAMRNSPPQAVLWTDGNRSAPYLAVFDAGASRTDGLGASSNVAAASLSGASRQRTYPSCRI